MAGVVRATWFEFHIAKLERLAAFTRQAAGEVVVLAPRPQWFRYWFPMVREVAREGSATTQQATLLKTFQTAFSDDPMLTDPSPTTLRVPRRIPSMRTLAQVKRARATLNRLSKQEPIARAFFDGLRVGFASQGRAVKASDTALLAAAVDIEPLHSSLTKTSRRWTTRIDRWEILPPLGLIEPHM